MRDARLGRVRVTLFRARAWSGLLFRGQLVLWAPLVLRVIGAALGIALLAVLGSLPTLTKEKGALASVAAPLPSSALPESAPPPLFSSQENASQENASQENASQENISQGSTGRATADDPVYLNDASLDELQRLPGIGPKRARAIFDLRARLGRFRQVEDLLRVKGIGRATLKKLRPLVRVERRTFEAADAGAPSPTTALQRETVVPFAARSRSSSGVTT